FKSGNVHSPSVPSNDNFILPENLKQEQEPQSISPQSSKVQPLYPTKNPDPIKIKEKEKEQKIENKILTEITSENNADNSYKVNNNNTDSEAKSKTPAIEILPQKEQQQQQQQADQSSTSSLLPLSIKYLPSSNSSSMRDANFTIHTEPTTVTINIGRIDVRAVMSQKPSPTISIPIKDTLSPSPSPSQQNSLSSNNPSFLSLKDYLKQRSERLF
ncbi:MAG: hypothetical protein H0X03_09000, partial [Nitrosopumilus sp.]|nr:hypothetical protein [Nitrosopumilus sp.]